MLKKIITAAGVATMSASAIKLDLQQCCNAMITSCCDEGTDSGSTEATSEPELKSLEQIVEEVVSGESENTSTEEQTTHEATDAVHTIELTPEVSAAVE